MNRPNIDIMLKAALEIAQGVSNLQYTGETYERVLNRVTVETYRRIDEANAPTVDYKHEYEQLYWAVRSLQEVILQPLPPGFMGLDCNSIVYLINKLLNGRTPL